jgi:hypothetical protein
MGEAYNQHVNIEEGLREKSSQYLHVPKYFFT